MLMNTLLQTLAGLPALKKLPWRAPLRVIPQQLQLLAAQAVANHLLREQLEQDELDFLEGPIMRIRITDLGYDWGISKLGNKLVFVNGCDDAEGSITGNSHEFLMLASRREDADTLFFQRRLIIEGNTELGLQVKNLIDSIDLEEFPAAFNHAVAAGADFSEVFGGVRR